MGGARVPPRAHDRLGAELERLPGRPTSAPTRSPSRQELGEKFRLCVQRRQRRATGRSPSRDALRGAVGLPGACLRTRGALARAGSLPGPSVRRAATAVGVSIFPINKRQRDEPGRACPLELMPAKRRRARAWHHCSPACSRTPRPRPRPRLSIPYRPPASRPVEAQRRSGPRKPTAIQRQHHETRPGSNPFRSSDPPTPGRGAAGRPRHRALVRRIERARIP